MPEEKLPSNLTILTMETPNIAQFRMDIRINFSGSKPWSNAINNLGKLR